MITRSKSSLAKAQSCKSPGGTLPYWNISAQDFCSKTSERQSPHKTANQIFFDSPESLRATNHWPKRLWTLGTRVVGITRPKRRILSRGQLLACHLLKICLSLQLEEACEMSVKLGKESVRKNLKAFALQNFGMLFGFAIMFVLAVYGGDISVQ